MIITCPRCSTRYVIDPAVLVPNGRAVGCTNCGHHWTQAPPAPGDVAPAAEPPPPVPPAPAEEGAEAPPAEQSPAESSPESPADVESGAETQPAAEGGEERERQTLANGESAAGPLDSDAALAEAEEQPAASEPPAQEKEPENDKESEVSADAGETPSTDTEPEPIPAALREGRSPAERGRQSQKKKPSVALLAGIGALAALIVIVVVLVVARGPIVSAIPGAAGLYRGVGLLGDEAGAGLEITDVRSARQRDGADEVLTIEGIVANVTDEPIEVPTIRVSLSDADGEELQFVIVPPEIPSLPPGETAAFEARISNPSAIVRRVKVKFVALSDSPSDH